MLPTIFGNPLWFNDNQLVEGLVRDIDFCNHNLKAAATWKVDGTGSITRVPFSMYLLPAEKSPFEIERDSHQLW
jgi:hypothetical protein